MKRISLAATMVAGCLAAQLPSSARAVNPTNQNSPFPNQNQLGTGNGTNPYGTNLIPGQGYYNYNTNNGLDPLLNTNFYTVPGYPSLNDPLNRTVPTPSTYPTTQDRDRLNSGFTPNYVAPGQQNSTQLRKWRLGVYSKDMDTGVRIHNVVQGGAAHRAGLEANDQIISVNGYQVGYVNGQLFDCGTEFDRLADANGWVNILVQNNRDMKLINVPVQLESLLSTLNGSIALSAPNSLPSNAVVNVELREVLNNAPSGVTLISKRIDNYNKYPIPFTIDFDPQQLNSGRRYVVYANATVNGRETHRTQNLAQVLNSNGQVRPVALQLDQIAITNPGNNPGTYPGTTYPGYNLGYTQDNAQVAQIVRWYNDYLGRNPSDRELVNWMQTVAQGQPLAQVQLALLANEQFFNRCESDKRVYVTRMHELLIGRAPTVEELNYWVARYDAQGGIRRDLAREFQGALGIH